MYMYVYIYIHNSHIPSSRLTKTLPFIGVGRLVSTMNDGHFQGQQVNLPGGNKCIFPYNQWPFQEPKLEVPNIYKAYVGAM